MLVLEPKVDFDLLLLYSTQIYSRPDSKKKTFNRYSLIELNWSNFRQDSSQNKIDPTFGRLKLT